MKREDRRRWQEAVTLANLGQLMALWLEGRIGSWPGYASNCPPDEETQHLIRPLAAMCRAGFVTVQSQPGLAGPDYQGKDWRQRAAVEGFVSDRALLARLQSAARSVDAEVSMDQPIVATTRAGRPYTAFGGRPSRGQMRCMWPVISKPAYAALEASTHLAIVAPEYGSAGERLWPALARAIR